VGTDGLPLRTQRAQPRGFAYGRKSSRKPSATGWLPGASQAGNRRLSDPSPRILSWSRMQPGPWSLGGRRCGNQAALIDCMPTQPIAGESSCVSPASDARAARTHRAASWDADDGNAWRTPLSTACGNMISGNGFRVRSNYEAFLFSPQCEASGECVHPRPDGRVGCGPFHASQPLSRWCCPVTGIRPYWPACGNHRRAMSSASLSR